MVLFLPPVFFAALVTRRPVTALVAGSVLSAAIEALQALISGIGRACDTNDWLMNTIGALLAFALTRVRRAGRPADVASR